MSSSNDLHQAPKGMFRVIIHNLTKKGLDYESLEQASTALDRLSKIPDTAKHTITIYDDKGTARKSFTPT